MQPWVKWVLGIVAAITGAGIIGATVTLASHSGRIVAVETRQESQGAAIKETRKDVKAIRSVVDRMAGRMGVRGSRPE